MQHLNKNGQSNRTEEKNAATMRYFVYVMRRGEQMRLCYSANPFLHVRLKNRRRRRAVSSKQRREGRWTVDMIVGPFSDKEQARCFKLIWSRGCRKSFYRVVYGLILVKWLRTGLNIRLRVWCRERGILSTIREHCTAISARMKFHLLSVISQINKNWPKYKTRPR